MHRNQHKDVVKKGTQTNIPQMNEQEKSLEKKQNEMEASNLLGTQFKKWL